MSKSKRKIVRIQDLVGKAEYAELSIGDMEIHRLGAGDLAGLFIRFPAVAAIANGEKIGVQEMLSIGDTAPDAIPAIVAIAIGKPGRSGVMLARLLSAGDQIKVVARTIEISFPEGIATFLEDLTALMPAAPVAEPVVVDEADIPDL